MTFTLTTRFAPAVTVSNVARQALDTQWTKVPVDPGQILV
jgi:hypothetical protein